jgi:ABC-type Zn uptake system ZnuABC Zn-binding protein ZnuA
MAGRAAAAEALPVVASFSILGDLTQQIGGDRVQVYTLVGPAPTRTSTSRPRATPRHFPAPDW